MIEMKAFMIDLDGTIYKGNKTIPGALDFISSLKERNIPFVFLTNNSSNSRSYYLEKLNRMGFDIELKNVLTSTTATIRFLMTERNGRSVFPLGTDGFVKELTDAGIAIDEEDPDIVLLAFDRSITYGKINNAYRLLMKGKEFIATHPDDLCPTENGYDIDIGPFIRMFESMTERKAIVIGKPNASMIDMAALEMNVSKNGIVMVGDRMYTDMKMAKDAGIGSILVLSGETQRSDIEGSGIMPDIVVNSVKDIPDMMQ